MDVANESVVGRDFYMYLTKVLNFIFFYCRRYSHISQLAMLPVLTFCFFIFFQEILASCEKAFLRSKTRDTIMCFVLFLKLQENLVPLQRRD
jgi:hypothetical protein